MLIIGVLFGVALLFFTGSFFFGKYQAKNMDILTLPVVLEPTQEDFPVLNLPSGNPTDRFLVNIWATWCAPCLEELPLFTKLELPEGTTLVSLCGDCPEGYQNTAGPFPVYRQKQELFLYAWPTTLLIDGQGKELNRRIGSFATREEILAFATGQ